MPRCTTRVYSACSRVSPVAASVRRSTLPAVDEPRTQPASRFRVLTGPSNPTWYCVTLLPDKNTELPLAETVINTGCWLTDISTSPQFVGVGPLGVNQQRQRSANFCALVRGCLQLGLPAGGVSGSLALSQATRLARFFWLGRSAGDNVC